MRVADDHGGGDGERGEWEWRRVCCGEVQPAGELDRIECVDGTVREAKGGDLGLELEVLLSGHERCIVWTLITRVRSN